MIGAICGDVIGSPYEKENIKTKDFQLFSKEDRFTDDTVLTCAIAEATMEYAKNKNLEDFRINCIAYLKAFGMTYPNAGYGGTFINWIFSDNFSPYNSWGNGSAMRVSPVAYVAETLEEAEILATVSAIVTHNHPFGVAGAKAVAGAIWKIRNGASKEDVKKYIEDNYYELNFTIDGIRKDYQFDVSCQGSVPQAIQSFLEADSFEDTIRNAISIGGDSDTIAAIAGSIAEAYYGVPEVIETTALSFLNADLKETVDKFYSEIVKRNKPVDAELNK